MLTITPQASEAIRGILASQEVPDGSLLRISPQPQDGAQPGLAISVIESPPPEDELVEGDDVQVAVEPTTAKLLEDKELDATVASGQINFSISEQES